MPKIKTHSGTKKRIKMTGSGKLIRRKANLGHNLSKKSSARKRRLTGNSTVKDVHTNTMKHRLGVK